MRWKEVENVLIHRVQKYSIWVESSLDINEGIPLATKLCQDVDILRKKRKTV
jgi:hypothetical protein